MLRSLPKGGVPWGTNIVSPVNRGEGFALMPEHIDSAEFAGVSRGKCLICDGGVKGDVNHIMLKAVNAPDGNGGTKILCDLRFIHNPCTTDPNLASRREALEREGYVYRVLSTAA